MKTHRYKTSNFYRGFPRIIFVSFGEPQSFCFPKGWSRKKTQDLGNGIDFPFIAIGFP